MGRVLRVRASRHDTWRVRLGDTGGALAAAEIPFSMLPPAVGSRIVVRGQLSYDERHASDGWRCLWGQRVDAGGRLVGVPFPARHFHGVNDSGFGTTYGRYNRMLWIG
jgi:hypothetical protein